MGKVERAVRSYLAYIYFWAVFPTVIFPLSVLEDTVKAARDRWAEIRDSWRELKRRGR